MDYFYAPPSRAKGKTIIIDGEELHHLSKVLRKKVGEVLTIVDGKDHAYRTVLKSISQTGAECEVQETLYRWHEPEEVELRLAVAMLKNPSRFDSVVEKCTELGVREILPMKTARTIVSRVHLDRLQKIALSAMKQCGRSFLPPIYSPLNLGETLERLEGCDEKIILDENSNRGINSIKDTRMRRGKTGIGILVGPEGGFTKEEIEQAVEAGFQPISLGNRRLRTETAAIVASALFLT
jgi:16S rRNA (uracil1498-N3)-methyltransferase